MRSFFDPSRTGRSAAFQRAASVLRTGFALAMSLGAACQQRTARKPPAAAAPAADAWPALDEQLLTAAAQTAQFRLGRPQPLAVAPDGSVLFRRTPPRARRADLFTLDPQTGQARELLNVDALLQAGDEKLSAAERARRERSRTQTSGVVDIGLSSSGERVLVPLGERLFVLERRSGRVHELGVGPGFPFDPQLSPDGQHVAFVRDGDLWVCAADGGGEPRRLTQHEPHTEYGSAEFVAQEELDRKSGYVWSPDSRKLAFQRTDASAVDTLYVSDPRHPEREPTPFKYPRAGRPNARVDLGVVAINDKSQPRFIRWDLERLPYLAHLSWPENAPLTVLALSRDQTTSVLFAIDADSGALRELLRERDDSWLNLKSGSPTWLSDGSGFLWLHEEEAGYALQLRAADGALTRTLASPDQGVREIYAAFPDAVIVAASQDPREQHVYRIPLAGGPAERLTEAGGVHAALAEHGVVVINSEPREGGFRSEAVALPSAGDAQNARRWQLPSLAEKPAVTPTTQLESVRVDGRDLYTSVTRPRSFQPGQRYPVLLRVYGGPRAHNVLDTKNGYLLDQIYADAGFIVLRAEGRGTPDRGRAFERAILKDLITLPLADQADALRALCDRHPELDRTRVGVFGWSFGGYLSTMAVLLRPDVFHAAVAGAPVTDWALYDTAYTERYMRTPAENPSGYAHTSALTHAAGLSRPLLLIHGLTDDNVHFAHALALIEALYAASKAVEVVALASTHMVVDPRQALAREKLQVEFFRKHLGRSPEGLGQERDGQ